MFPSWGRTRQGHRRPPLHPHLPQPCSRGAWAQAPSETSLSPGPVQRRVPAPPPGASRGARSHRLISQTPSKIHRKLRELALTAEKVEAAMLAALKPPAAPPKPQPEAAAKRPRSAPQKFPEIVKNEGDPASEFVPDHWVYPRGKRPCDLKGTGGPGLSRNGVRDWVRCTYTCGGKDVEKRFWGNSIEVCLDPRNRPVY